MALSCGGEIYIHGADGNVIFCLLVICSDKITTVISHHQENIYRKTKFEMKKMECAMCFIYNIVRIKSYMRASEEIIRVIEHGTAFRIAL